MKVLIVFEYVPEDTKVYLLDLEGKDLEKARKAHGVYVCCSKNDKAAAWLESFLSDKETIKIKAGKPIELDAELLIHSGFML